MFTNFSFAEEKSWLCFSPEEAGKLYGEVVEHRQVCPLISAEVTDLKEKSDLTEKQLTYKDNYVNVLQQEIDLEKQRLKTEIDLYKAQIQTCEKNLKKAKPSLFGEMAQTVVSILIGIGIGALLL